MNDQKFKENQILKNMFKKNVIVLIVKKKIKINPKK